MCNICSDWEKQRLTTEEAMRNIGESLAGAKDEKAKQHLIDLSGRIMDQEVPMPERDEDLEKKWYDDTHEE